MSKCKRCGRDIADPSPTKCLVEGFGWMHFSCEAERKTELLEAALYERDKLQAENERLRRERNGYSNAYQFLRSTLSDYDGAWDEDLEQAALLIKDWTEQSAERSGG